MRTIIPLCCLLAAPALAQPPAIDCMTSPPHRAFDFWLGEWEVRGPEGRLAGHNRITLEEGGCALRERWESAGGGTGQSLNYYHPETGRWRQLWLDAGSSIIDLSGGPEGDSMLLEGDIYYLGNGQRANFRGRWTLLPDGRVRQFFEQQDAAGAWQPWFEGFYRRTAPEP